MAEQAPRPPIRTLFIQTLFSLFLGIVVFVVLTYAFIVPQLVAQSARIQQLEMEVAQLKDEAAEDAEQGEEDADTTAEAPAAGIADGGTSAAVGTP